MLPKNVEFVLSLDPEPLCALSVLQESTIESYDVSITYLFSCLDILMLSGFFGGIFESVLDCLDWSTLSSSLSLREFSKDNSL